MGGGVTGGPMTGSVTTGSTTLGSMTSGGLTSGSSTTTGGTGSVSIGGSTTGGSSSGGVSAGGDTSSTGGMMIEASFETLKYVISNIQPSCAAADCHGANEHNPLNLQVNDGLYANLTMTISEDCGNIPVVNPSNPAQSALVMLLKGPCGDTPRMPAGCLQNEFENNCVPDEYIVAIEQWIANGAPQQ
jgi:hypothetical protein